jgi:hypothetical protein
MSRLPNFVDSRPTDGGEVVSLRHRLPFSCKDIPCTGLVVKALGYEPEGRGFETRRGEILNLPNPSGRIRPWGLLSL